MNCVPKTDETRQFVARQEEVNAHHFLRYVLASSVAEGRVLDAACGCGYGSRFLWEKTQDVVGVDIHPPAIEWANKHFPGPSYLVGDLEKEPWEGRFQAVVSLETLEHLPRPEIALEGFRRACRGVLVASVPNEEVYPFDPKKFEGDQYPHQRHYTPGEFDQLLTSCGWKVLDRFSQKSKQEPIPQAGTAGAFLIYVCE